MAEGFARKYGTDVMEASSAGLSPASIVQPLTKKVMEAKNIRLDGQFPKDLSGINARQFDVVVNMSGAQLSGRFPADVRKWEVEDPIGCDEDVYVTVRDEIEMLVMRLILELRRESRKSQPSLPGREAGPSRANRRS
jgi:protein-tyrosine-phosphatase